MTEQHKRPYRIELTAAELDAAEEALHVHRRRKFAGPAFETALDAVRGAELIDDDEPDEIDLGRTSEPSDIRAFEAHAAATNTPDGRRRNTQMLQGIIDLHYPPHTEKGQH